MNKKNPCSPAIDVVLPAYDPPLTITRTLESILSQNLTDDLALSIVIVDDGSKNPVVNQLPQTLKTKLRIIRHEKNRGRASACNTGWKSGCGDSVLFLDSDCWLKEPDAITKHLMTLNDRADVSCGLVLSECLGFWDRYNSELQQSRLKSFLSGNVAAFTTANCAFRREALELVDGFDERYQHYGFEDRDLLLRLAKQGQRIRYSPNAVAVHAGTQTLKNISQKLKESGRYSSGRFLEIHASEYRESQYGHLDFRNGKIGVKLLILAGAPMLSTLTRAGDRIIVSRIVPYRLKRLWVRIVSGLAYAVGTSQS